jgi:hypothetical protein
VREGGFVKDKVVGESRAYEVDDYAEDPEMVNQLFDASHGAITMGGNCIIRKSTPIKR